MTITKNTALFNGMRLSTQLTPEQIAEFGRLLRAAFTDLTDAASRMVIEFRRLALDHPHLFGGHQPQPRARNRARMFAKRFQAMKVTA